MNIPYLRGLTTRQAHVSIPDGTVEEEYGRNGFFGKYAHLYRSRPPTDWSRIEGNLKPRAYDPKLPVALDFLAARKPLLYNSDVQLSLFQLDSEMPYFFRNADADELYFIHGGHGIIETDFGPVAYEPGDYIQIPRGTVYRILPQDAAKLLLIESFSELRFPEKGMLGEHALFDPAIIRVPTPNPKAPEEVSGREYEVKIQRCGEITSVFYPFHPITTVGWKGTTSVLQLNVRDIRPVSCDRYHLPPSAHTTFVADGFVVCSFLPRPLENGDPEALKVPFYHSNIDFDEVLFYHDGEFFSREGIGSGMLTFHPQGIHHGPQPRAIERSKGAQATQEVAVMLDTKKPLKLADWAQRWELQNYWKSWEKK
jgi:homogentisate 1,2-dioxygenase